MIKRKHKFLAFIGTVFAVLIAGVCTSCTDTTIAKFTSLGNKHRIELLDCNGKTVRTYMSTGKVQNPEGSDGYQFMNDSTGLLTEVSGNVIVTTLNQ